MLSISRQSMAAAASRVIGSWGAKPSTMASSTDRFRAGILAQSS